MNQHLTDQPTLILTHHPLVVAGAKWLDKYRAENLDRFWDLAYGKNILGTLSGHVHISYEKSVSRTIS